MEGERCCGSDSVCKGDSKESETGSVEDLIDIKYFSKIKLKVGTIEAAEPVEGSDKLLKLTVSLGEQEGTRQLVAGIAREFEAASLTGRQIVVVANLKPAKLMGVVSQGMLLAVGEKVPLALLQPDKDVPDGSPVS